MRAEIQGAQSAAEFMGAVAEGPKLQFLEMDGYLRLRGQLFDNLDLGVGTDSSGYPLFPQPLENSSGKRGTLASANMRLRLEPTMNISEHVRVRAQVDVLDNYVLGSSNTALFDGSGSPYPVPFYGEVQTPVGLLSFGRMPSQWGLGILAHAGQGLDDDYGDTVDRIQFALPPVTTPVGSLNFVPMIDFDSEGVLHLDPRFGGGVGQPFDAESGDDARTYALKIARLDTEDEIRRKLERNERSVPPVDGERPRRHARRDPHPGRPRRVRPRPRPVGALAVGALARRARGHRHLRQHEREQPARRASRR